VLLTCVVISMEINRRYYFQVNCIKNKQTNKQKNPQMQTGPAKEDHQTNSGQKTVIF